MFCKLTVVIHYTTLNKTLITYKHKVLPQHLQWGVFTITLSVYILLYRGVHKVYKTGQKYKDSYG